MLGYTDRLIGRLGTMARRARAVPPTGIEQGGRGVRKGGAMTNDHFPETQETFINRCLGSQPPREEDLRRHLMAVYAAPLRAYFLGTSYRRITDPDEIINGFFIDRLSRANFLPEWRKSGMKLRRWLMNALQFYLKEYTRYEGRRAARGAEDMEQMEGVGPELTAAMDREFVKSVVRRAMSLARESCEADGFGQHYEFFHLYYISGRTCESLGRDTGVGADRAWVMVRTGQRRFVRALREVLIDDGVAPGKVDDEIAGLLKLTGEQREGAE